MIRRFGAKGMTLIEIMVVITILGILATVVTVNVMGRLEKGRIEGAKISMKGVEQALDQYRLDNGNYPATEQGIQALVTASTFGRTPQRFQEGGYLKGGKVPKDPWGEEFVYTSPGVQGHPYEIYSKGPDGQAGTDDDIKSWED